MIETSLIGSQEGDMAHVFVVVILVTVLAQQGTLATYCRFASTSARQGTCIFPCRCTNGCDKTNGYCINDGQCEDGYPSGYRWTQQDCQTGNIAYNKKAFQSNGDWASRYPAGNAVDGDTNPNMFNNHCAHPDTTTNKNAWWMVDFEERYTILRVIIYNRADSNPERLNTFILSVGDSERISEHRECIRHNSNTVVRPSIEVECHAVGRYLSFRRNGGVDKYATGLCEVVVIGHRHISCTNCPARSSCNDVIGCLECNAGQQQPDCIKSCERRTYGTNCKEDCGHCKDNVSCEAVRGHCVGGCESWYIPDLCKTYISIAHFDMSDEPVINEISNSSAVVTWSKANGISPGLDKHYYYLVWLLADGDISWKSQKHDVEKAKSSIIELQFNTNYSVKIEPFRHQNDKHEGGTATGVAGFKTKCVAPDIPVIWKVMTSAKTTSFRGSIFVAWKKIAHSGCDVLVDVRVAYRLQRLRTAPWSWKDTENITNTRLKIHNLENEAYELKVTATNNEKINSFSKIVTATLRPNPKTVNMNTSGGSGSGLAAGVSVSVIVVLAIVSVTIFILLRRRRAQQNKHDRDNVPVVFSTEHYQGNTNRAHRQGDDEENTVLGTVQTAGHGDSHSVAEQVKVTEAEYVNTLQVTRDIAVGDIAACVEGKRRQNGFKSEFQQLPYGIRLNCTAAKKPQNKNKNRFKDIIAYDHTRVILAANKERGDYINASYIMGYNDKKHAYIACQGPRDTTIDDMWRMVWQVNSNTIVMLANLVEDGKDKCIKYWPEKNDRRTWGQFSTESVGEEKVADYVVRQLSLRNQETGDERRVRQFHFTSWPDKGTPQYAYPLLAFRRKVHSFDRAIRGPLVVHCSAGVGRTGTFIAIDILNQQAAAEGTIDVIQCVTQLRTQRMNMVQTLDQYVFVYQAMIESSQTTVVPCSSLRQTFDELRGSREMEEQFERLNALKPLAKNAKRAALDPSNIAKNRDIDIIPDDRYRPYLLTHWTSSTNYINAVFVHGYKERNAYIVTQSPMASTVIDLWRLLADHECRTVVMLDDCDVTDDLCAIYWPTNEGARQQFGPFQVQLQTVISATSNITVREFYFTKSGGKKENAITIKQFHLTGAWNRGASLPRDKTVILELLGLLEKWQQVNGNGPVTVHCSDGASRCGLVCAAAYVLEHMKVEQEVDVFHAVQHIRTTRPQLIVDKEQYAFLYEMALDYMLQFDEYANFR